MNFPYILALRPLLLAMQERNLQASWKAMLDVAACDGRSPAEALRVVRKRPGCLIAPAEEFKGQWPRDFVSGETTHGRNVQICEA